MTDTVHMEPKASILNELESGLLELINDENSNLEDLSAFWKNLTKENTEVPLTQKNLEQLKADLKNGGLVDFQGGEIEGERFGFEVIGNDIQPTLTPKGDAIIPINFRYDSQRRTKLLVLHIKDKQGKNIYTLPGGENMYDIEIKRIQFKYQLRYDPKGFHLILLK